MLINSLIFRLLNVRFSSQIPNKTRAPIGLYIFRTMAHCFPRIVQLNIELCIDIVVCASLIVKYIAEFRTLTNASSLSIKWS